jgi:hypothetical protein
MRVFKQICLRENKAKEITLKIKQPKSKSNYNYKQLK